MKTMVLAGAMLGAIGLLLLGVFLGRNQAKKLHATQQTILIEAAVDVAREADARKRKAGMAEAVATMQNLEKLGPENRLALAEVHFSEIRNRYADFGDEAKWWTDYAWAESRNRELESELVDLRSDVDTMNDGFERFKSDQVIEQTKILRQATRLLQQQQSDALILEEATKILQQKDTKALPSGMMAK